MVGTAFPPGCEAEAAFLTGCAKRNKKLLKPMRADPHAADLMRQTEVDAALGRMSKPVEYGHIDLASVAIASRFGVEQGTRADNNSPATIRAHQMSFH